MPTPIFEQIKPEVTSSNPLVNPKASKTSMASIVGQDKAHFFRTLGRIFKYGASGFKRNIWLSAAATLVMTFTLVLLFVTVIASIVLSSTADAMREKIDITIFFKPGTSEQTLEQMANTMQNNDNVKNVEIASTEAEIELFINETKARNDEKTLTALSDEDLAKSLREYMPATMRVKVYDSNDLSSIKNLVYENETFVENLSEENEPTFNTNDAAIETITSWANIAKTGGLVLSAIFLVISTLVIFNTIRMAIFSRREEIYMEKLVGADNSFIRGPFIVEAILSGIFAGIFSSIISYLAYYTLAPKLSGYDIDISSVSTAMNSGWVVIIFLAMILLSCLIGFLSARLAVRKYLR